MQPAIALTFTFCAVVATIQHAQSQHPYNDQKHYETPTASDSISLPTIHIESASASHYYYNGINYVMQKGDPLMIFCSGSDSANLILSKESEQLRTAEVNETTIVFAEPAGLEESRYWCNDTKTGANDSVFIYVKSITPRALVQHLGMDAVNKDNTSYNLLLCSGRSKVWRYGKSHKQEELYEEFAEYMLQWVESTPDYEPKNCTNSETGNSSVQIRIDAQIYNYPDLPRLSTYSIKITVRE